MLLPLAFALCLCACNVYQRVFDTGPSTPADHVVEGQALLRQARYVEAQAEFDLALSQDSSLSEAYLGGAKSVLLIRRINVFSLLASFQNHTGNNIPFLNEPDSVKDKLFTANRGINKYLSRLVTRDKSGKTDGKVTVANIAADYALSSAIEAVLSLADFNNDGRIDSNDNLLTGIIDLKNLDSLTPDKIMTNLNQLKNDTVKIQALNGLLDKSQTLLQQSDAAVDVFVNSVLGSGKVDSLTGGKSDAIGDSSIQSVKDFIHNAGAKVVIYKVQDHVDNDGDGCADEEFLDGIDNDGDGVIDEDSRGVPDSTGNPFFYADHDGADNNGDGVVDDSSEAEFLRRYRASFDPMALLTHPERQGQIFWKDSAGIQVDTRRKVILVLDSTANPPVLDTVTTFDLCHGKVKGFKSLLASP